MEPMKEMKKPTAMFSHVSGDDWWKEKPLDEVLAMVDGGAARECFDHDNYDDGMRNFHCVFPCQQCDTLHTVDDDAEDKMTSREKVATATKIINTAEHALARLTEGQCVDLILDSVPEVHHAH